MPNKTPQDIPALIRSAMERQGIRSVAELSRQSGVPYASIREYLSGDHDLAAAKVAMLLAALDLEIRPKPQRSRRKKS